MKTCRAVRHVTCAPRVAGPPLNPRAVRGTRTPFAGWQRLALMVSPGRATAPAGRVMLPTGQKKPRPVVASRSISLPPFPVEIDALAGVTTALPVLDVAPG